MNSQRARRYPALLAPAITVIVLVLLIRHVAGASEWLVALRTVRWELVPIPVALCAFNVAFAVVRWRVIVRAMGYDFPFGVGLNAVLAAWPLSVVIPSRAGDLFRPVCVRQYMPVFAGVGSTLAEKAVDVQSLCLLSLVGTAAHGQWPLFSVAAAILIAEWVSLFLLGRYREHVLGLRLLRRWETKLRQMFIAFDSLRARPRYLVKLVGASLIAWMVTATMVYLLLLAVGAPIPIVQVASVWPLALFVGLIPVTTAGMGTRDAAFLYLVTATSAAAPEAAPVLLATFAYSLISAWLFAIIGIPFMIRLDPMRGASADEGVAPTGARNTR